MKCNELEKFDAASNADLSAGYDHRYAYEADEVDAAIAELKAKLESVNELIKTARQMLEDAKAAAYADSVDAGMRERRLKRALYKACANWACAKMEYEQLDSDMFMCGFVTGKEVSWESMMKNCLKKAEEYK